MIKFAALVVFLILSLQLYVREEFLQTKIQTQYEDQTTAAKYNLGETKGESGRFFAFITSFKLFLNNPVFGRGIIYVTSEKATGEMHEEASYGYGLMGLLSTYGFLFGLYYLVRMYYGIKALGSINRTSQFMMVTLFTVLNLALLTQVFMLSTVVVVIVIFGLYYKPPLKYIYVATEAEKEELGRNPGYYHA
jgi:hypothetical protein